MCHLEDAIALAALAHRGQVDKAGLPYVLHPIRVMLALDSETERIVGVLHDLIEDTDCSLEDLRHKGFPPEVIGAVDCLTRRPGEDYDAYVARVRINPVARRVKLADLEDNLDASRLPEITPKDQAL